MLQQSVLSNLVITVFGPPAAGYEKSGFNITSFYVNTSLALISVNRRLDTPEQLLPSSTALQSCPGVCPGIPGFPACFK